MSAICLCVAMFCKFGHVVGIHIIIVIKILLAEIASLAAATLGGWEEMLSS